MTVLRFNILGSPNIGVFSLATDKFAIFPVGLTQRKIERIKNVLKVEVVCLDLAESKLIGVLAEANSNGIILPFYVSDEEVDFLKKNLGINVERIESKKTAFGNLVLANDQGALVSPILSKKEVKKIEDVLGVEVFQGSLAGYPYVGSVAVATNKGILAHPNISEDESKFLTEIFKAPVNIGTVNGGIPFVGSGITINSYGALVGSLTTGPELMAISTIL
ncbi:translation initiation factor IF-6 [Candidatus Bathyarchaeota archaeon]|nr:MAG: translation initiation factor IF-6 [Candidatus Bathyarchaeota archaeon]